MKIRRIHCFLGILAVLVCLIPYRTKVRIVATDAIHLLKGRRTVYGQVAEYEPSVRQRLGDRFNDLQIEYPPSRMVIIALKDEKMIEVWVTRGHGQFKRLKNYPVLAASGRLGPKLLEGDRQVPEGIYGIDSLNPNSAFHLSLRLDYPNKIDRQQGKRDGRADLGSDIMIHGASTSIGCLAIGDEPIEELFVLAAKTGIDNVSVVISPLDFRVRKMPEELKLQPAWVHEVYSQVMQELNRYR